MIIEAYSGGHFEKMVTIEIKNSVFLIAFCVILGSEFRHQELFF